MTKDFIPTYLSEQACEVWDQVKVHSCEYVWGGDRDKKEDAIAGSGGEGRKDDEAADEGKARADD